MAKKLRFRLFHKKNTGPPGGIEVKTAIASNNVTVSSSNGSTSKGFINANNDNVAPLDVAEEDEVSAMTPATGMPPDSPDRLRNLSSLLRPPSQSTPTDTINEEEEKSDEDRGALDLNFPDDDDDISAMTPTSPQRWEGRLWGEVGGGDDAENKKKGKQKYQLRWRGVSPRNILPGEDSPGGITVYEEDEASSSGWERRQQHHHQQQQQQNVTPTIIPASTSNPLQGRQSSSSSWLTRTKYFQKAIDSSFEMIDVDKSGDVSLEELYAGLLLIHLNMAVYVGPPACRPASKAYVTEIFHLLDTDNSGSLTKDEYATVVKILYSQVFTRIVMQWSLTLLIVPVITQYIIKYITVLYYTSSEYWNDNCEFLDPLQNICWKVWSLLLSFTIVERLVQSLSSNGKMIPSGIWKTLPFTILTLGQTSVLLPWVLHRVENIFRRAAQSNAVKNVDENQTRKK